MMGTTTLKEVNEALEKAQVKITGDRIQSQDGQIREPGDENRQKSELEKELDALIEIFKEELRKNGPSPGRRMPKI